MTENMLVSLDDAALEDVNGGASFGFSFNDKTVLGGSLDLTKTGLTAGITLFGKTLSIGVVSPIEISLG